MWGEGRAGHGERGRIAARVRRLLGDAPDEPGLGANGEDTGGTSPLRWQLDEPTEPTEPGGPTGGRLSGRQPGPRWRLDPGRRAAAAIGVCALLAALVSGWWVLSARPRSLALAGSQPSGSPVGSGTSVEPGSPVGTTCAQSSGPAAHSVVVDVSGKVHRPGVYTLPVGARVVDAVTAAGGALPGISLTGLNLAARVNDGQQVAVGVPPAAPAGPAVPGAASAGMTGSAGPGGGTVNLNAAGLDELQTLPGIGPVTAQHILDWRVQHGQFTSVDQLREVSGIGDVKFAELKPLVSV